MKTKQFKVIISFLMLAITACNAEKQGENEMVTLSISANEMAYIPTELHLKKNVPYTVNFANNGNVLHDWNVKNIPNKKLEVKPSEKTIHNHTEHSSSSDLHVGAESNSENKIAFILLKSGNYEYYCSVPGHREAGMKGTILVHE